MRGGGGGKREFLAVDDVSFDVPFGTTFGLVGHNGSGKSTLLKLMAGVYRPTSGRIGVSGRVSALIELGAGFHGELTGRENIRLNGAILGLSKTEVEKSMDAIIDFADIGPFIDVPVKTYSSGMYVRLGFAIAVMLDPEILIVDEIIAVGDEAFQRKCFDYLYRLRRDGSTIVLVTHSLGLARDLCDSGIWMDHGRGQLLGPINEVVDAYVADVNRKEEEQLDQVSDAAPIHLDRRGSGEAQIQNLRILNSQGAEQRIVHTGEEYIFRIDIEGRTDVEDVGIGVAFNLENGSLLAGPNSGQEHRAYDVRKGTSFVDFRVPSLFLQPGTYWISASLGTNGHVWDYVDKGWKLVVRSDDSADEPGPVRILGAWSEHLDQSLTRLKAPGEERTDAK